MKNKTCRCIYELEGDLLRTCGPEAGAARPITMSSAPGSGCCVMTFRKLKK
jgi:hypothetical protein